MKKIFGIFLLITISLLWNGCSSDFGDLFKDPNRTENAPSSLIFNGVLNDMFEGAWGSTARYNQFHAYNYNYYGNQEYNWTGATLNFITLKNVIRMEEEALASGAKAANPYSALGKFFRAYFYYNMTCKVGDLPLTDALQSLDVQNPKYDSQKAVFVQILKWLDASNTELSALVAAADNSLLGDIYFDNKLAAWQKAVNSFTLRVLIALSKKESESELNVKAKFAEILGNPSKYPLIGQNSEALQYKYNSVFNKYPTNPDNYGFDATRLNLTATHLNTLVSLKDPRTFIVAEPAPKRVASGKSPTSFDAFLGASSAEDLADMTTKAGNGEYSFIGRKRYYSTYTAENTIIIGYPELCFNIAEAAHRGWISGSAEDWYKKGILASMDFYGIKTGDLAVSFQKLGGKLGEFDNYSVAVDLNNYLNQTEVKYAGKNETGLRQIITQKYLAFYQNSGWEPYYNFRRTGYPAFASNGPGTGNSGQIPKRFQYPSSELNTNKDNLNAALTSQFGGKDDINAAMWLIK